MTTLIHARRHAHRSSAPAIVGAALMAGALLLAPDAHASGAGAIASITKSAGIFTATVVGIALSLATGAIGIGGYKIMFQGAQFRDVANLFVGAAVCMSAAAIAAIFA